MQQNNQPDEHPDKQEGSRAEGFFISLLQGAIRDTIGMWVSVLIGTIIGAVICLYFGIPLIFSLVGGLLVMAVYMSYVRL